MNLNEYQTRALKTAIYPTETALTYTVLGLASEAGEVAGKLKKLIRDGDGELTPHAVGELAAEAGDCLWYIAAVADALGLTLDQIAEYNLAKLGDRQARGKLGGSGDQR